MTIDPSTTPAPSAGWRGKLAGAALILALLSVLWFLIAALGTKFGVWSWQFGLETMTLRLGRIIVMTICALSLTALIVSRRRANSPSCWRSAPC